MRAFVGMCIGLVVGALVATVILAATRAFSPRPAPSPAPDALARFGEVFDRVDGACPAPWGLRIERDAIEYRCDRPAPIVKARVPAATKLAEVAP